MNSLTMLQKCLVGICITGGAGCLAVVLAISLKGLLRNECNRWQRLAFLKRVLCILVLTAAVLYAGTKPPSSGDVQEDASSGEATTTNEPPAGIEGDLPTNTPPDVIEGDLPTNTPPDVIEGDAPTNVPPDTVGGDAPTNTPPPVMMMSRPRQTMMSPPPNCNPPPATNLLPIANWTTRGAWCDWKHIEFPECFEFPVGTNMLVGVTLMANGSIREKLADPTPVVALPNPVSLEPGVSTCAYGLTDSNSFLVAWSNVCVERDATNRTDASIELFDSGDMTVRFGEAITNIVARPPEGFVGEAQDNDWLAASFPGDYASITNDGYDAWLADYIGHNEPNGRYKCTVTVNALPEHGPCYLVCGPYRMVVKQPGDYSFPLMDFVEYDLYTCPTDVPLSWSDDDGWDPPESDYMPLLMSPAPRMLLGAPNNGNHHYKIQRFPEVFVHPNVLSHSEALNEIITVGCNAAGIAARDYTSLSGRARLFYTSPTTVEIQEADIQDAIYFYFEYNGESVCGTLSIYEDHYCPYWPYCPYGDDCIYHHDNSSNSTNDTGSASTP